MLGWWIILFDGFPLGMSKSFPLQLYTYVCVATHIHTYMCVLGYMEISFLYKYCRQRDGWEMICQHKMTYLCVRKPLNKV